MKWKAVVGFESVYEVSDTGKVRRTGAGRGTWAGRFLRPTAVKAGGYMRVDLNLDGKRYVRLVHRLVLEAFVGPRPKGAHSCHFDGNPKNNRLRNLRWGTYQDNADDKIRHGRAAKKLTRALVKEIRQSPLSSRAEAARHGLSKSTVLSIRNLEIWR